MVEAVGRRLSGIQRGARVVGRDGERTYIDDKGRKVTCIGTSVVGPDGQFALDPEKHSNDCLRRSLDSVIIN